MSQLEASAKPMNACTASTSAGSERSRAHAEERELVGVPLAPDLRASVTPRA